MCPAEKCVPGSGAHGPRPTGRYVEPRVGDGVLQWSAAEQMPLGYGVPYVPSERQRCHSEPVLTLAWESVSSQGRTTLSARFATHSRDFVGDGVLSRSPVIL